MTRPSHRKSGFTLLEAVAAIVVLAIVIPPTITMLASAANARGDAVSLARGGALADAVLEQVVADVASDDAALGFAALDDPSTYLNDASTGLRARIAPLTAIYEQARLSYDLSIGQLVDQAGTVSGDADQDIYRLVTVSVQIPSTSGPSLTMTVATMVTDLQ